MNTRRLPEFEYLKPTSLEEACALLKKHGAIAKVFAGGTELLIRLKQRLSTPNYLISLNAIPELNHVQYDEKTGLDIGSLATLESLFSSPVVRQKYAILAEAIRQTSALPLHYVSTIGGNLCQDTRCIYYNQSSDWHEVRPVCFKRGGNVCHAVKGGKRCLAVYQSDLAPVLMALNGKVRIARKGRERILPIAEFFTGAGDKPNVLEPNEIVTAIEVPPPSPSVVGSYQKLRVRGAVDFSLASVAVVLDIDGDRTCCRARVVLGAMAPVPIEVNGAEGGLEGKRVDNGVISEVAEEAFEAAHPVANLCIDATYRRKMIRVLLKRAIAQAIEKQRK